MSIIVLYDAVWQTSCTHALQQVRRDDKKIKNKKSIICETNSFSQFRYFGANIRSGRLFVSIVYVLYGIDLWYCQKRFQNLQGDEHGICDYASARETAWHDIFYSQSHVFVGNVVHVRELFLHLLNVLSIVIAFGAQNDQIQILEQFKNIRIWFGLRRPITEQLQHRFASTCLCDLHEGVKRIEKCAFIMSSTCTLTAVYLHQ